MSEPHTGGALFSPRIGRLGAVLTRSLGRCTARFRRGRRQAALVQPLRLLFVCCHEAVPAESRVAIALRTLCGFSTAEIALALLTTDANVQKRIKVAPDPLRDLDVDFERRLRPSFAPGQRGLRRRLSPFQSGLPCHPWRHADPPRPVREARLLAQMLAAHPVGDVPAVHALLALMCFHAARFDAQ